MKKIIIAIDGYSSCGKSTMAKDLAQEIGYIHIDSGAMYRAVTLFCLQNNLFCGEELNIEALHKAMAKLIVSFRLNPATGRAETILNGAVVEKEIRSMRVSERVSQTAAVPFVREAMVAQQQSMGRDKGIVMDGRDIGTTVFPNAELKIFVTASAETRARRRFDELKAKGLQVNFDDILNNVKQRDLIDTTRKISPLRKADDALILDNTYMTIEEQKQWLFAQYKRATGQNA